MSGAGTAVLGAAAPVPASSRALRVTVPLASFNLSGGVKVLVAIANAMAARGWPVEVLVPEFASDSPFPLHPGVRVRVLGTGGARLPRSLRALVHYGRLGWHAARGADVVLANYFPTAFCAVLSRALRHRRAVVVYYAQGYEAESHGLIAEANRVSRWARFAAARLSYRLPVRLFCVSAWVARRIGRADSVVAHAPALDLEVFQPRPRPARPRVTLGVIGRSGVNKGYQVFLDAVARLREREDLEIVVVSPRAGEVPPPTGVTVSMVEARSEAIMAGFYERCDIFVLPSYVEGFPLPPLEAMASGCAVVTTACGGVADYAVDGVNALVVPPGDSDALAAAVQRVCVDGELRRRLAQTGIETARRFARDRMAAEFLEAVEGTWSRCRR
ncbi:MAG: glycosyltransferase family 4 protein [Candidatus Rokubacteria bacterium]|nr:glycosyltransferase family 4 protein [Candidatus Rokubacteria bacterium]